ncbi:MAG TPA: DUF222 domain-containing protein [Aeromicrobium sp.]|nr:DUF222 domain-containing protein [Aeromicrobium sp.]
MFRSALDVGPKWAGRLAGSTSASARAEWVQWNDIVTVADRLNEQVDQTEDYFRRMVERSAIPLTIGRLVGLSEGQVSSRLAVADRVRTHAPRTWKSFKKGRVDAARVREISSAIKKLKLASSFERLDKLGLAYAETHTVAELRAWLKRFVVRVEPENFNARADEERRKRNVEIVHGDDGMSWMTIYQSSHILASISNRIDVSAKEQKLGADPDDDRTLDQRRADLASQWLLADNHGPVKLNVDVAVTIPLTALTGGTGDPAISADGQWAIPAAWALDEFMRSDTFWHRMVLDPVTNDMLATEYLGRYAPDVLTRALLFKYQVCQAPGCCKPAGKCDMDHRSPWPDGPTSGDNLWPLCRRHHNHKGHGILQWQLPDGQIVPVEKPDYALAS